LTALPGTHGSPDQVFGAQRHVSDCPFSLSSNPMWAAAVERSITRGKGKIMAGVALAGVGERRTFTGGVLWLASRFWFIVALIGQWAFFAYIAAFYGSSTASGHLEVWNRLEVLGRTPYVPGDDTGNAAYATHALGAGIIAFGGAL